MPYGELDVNASTLGGGVPTGTTSTINGGIDLAANAVCTVPGAFSDVDIWSAQIEGRITMTGNYGFAAPFICGNTIKGSVNVNNVTSIPTGRYVSYD